MDHVQAQRVIESLRKGIPPDGYVRHFTVGRSTEIAQLTNRLEDGTAGTLLLRANYGSGKTHLLRFVREHALDNGFAVSSVTLDCKAAVRFNRMDQVFGAVCRNLEVPSALGTKGIRSFLDLVVREIVKATPQKGGDFWKRLTNRGKWDYSEVLDSPAMFVAIRAWATGNPTIHDLVEDWFSQPWIYRTQKKILYGTLVERLRLFFRDPRTDRQFFAEGIFALENQAHAQCWAALRDLHTLAQKTGLRGLIILFDEFEDVVTNMNNISYQEDAFWNLFQFDSAKQFPGMSCYAVTPEFVEKCKQRLLDKARWDYDYLKFKSLSTFQMTPLTMKELEDLAMRIMRAHGIAYSWEPLILESHLEMIVRKAAAVQIQDRARHTIISVVQALDHLLESE